MHERDDWDADDYCSELDGDAAEELERLSTPLHIAEAEEEAHRLEKEREEYAALEAAYQAALENQSLHWNADEWEDYFTHGFPDGFLEDWEPDTVLNVLGTPPGLPEAVPNVSDRIRVATPHTAKPACQPTPPAKALPGLLAALFRPASSLAWMITLLALLLFAPMLPPALWLAATFSAPLPLAILAAYAALAAVPLALWGILRGIDSLRGLPRPRSISSPPSRAAGRRQR